MPRASVVKRVSKSEAVPLSPGEEGSNEFTPPQNANCIFAVICLSAFASQFGLSILATFFPAEAAAKHVNEAVLGWMFSIFELAVVFVTPLAAQLIVCCGSKPVTITGNVVGGMSNVALGLCWYLDGGKSFTICVFGLRICAGFGAALIQTTSFSILPAIFGPDISTAQGIMEVVGGVSNFLGPLAGSALYNAGGGSQGQGYGYVLPFLVLGGIEVSLGLLNILLVPELPAAPDEDANITNFSCKTLLPLLILVISGMNLGLLEPTLQPHLSAPPMSYSISLIGILFACAALGYAFFAPVVGGIDDATDGRYAYLMMAFGCYLSGCGYCWIAPAPLTYFGKELELDTAACWGGIGMVAIGCSFTMVPVMKVLLSYALHKEDNQRELAAGALMVMGISTGVFLGPTVGGALSAAIGIERTYYYCGLALLALAVFTAILAVTPAFRIK